jgi:hypothetical protein
VLSCLKHLYVRDNVDRIKENKTKDVFVLFTPLLYQRTTESDSTEYLIVVVAAYIITFGLEKILRR